MKSTNLDRVWGVVEYGWKLPEHIWKLAAEEYIDACRRSRVEALEELLVLRKVCRLKKLPVHLRQQMRRFTRITTDLTRITVPALTRHCESLERKIHAYRHPSTYEVIRRSNMLCGEQDALYENNRADEVYLQLLRMAIKIRTGKV